MLNPIRAAVTVLLVFLALQQKAFAASMAPFESNDSSPSYLPINSGDIHDLIDQRYSTLFFKPSGNMDLEQFLLQDRLRESLAKKESDFPSTFQPNFFNDDRSWIVFYLENKTAITHWKLQVNQFYIDKVNLYLFDETTKRLGNRQYFLTGLDDAEVNTLGRAISIELAPGKSYMLGVELIADTPINKPYIGLMSDARYSKWSFRTGLIHHAAFGVVIAVVLLAISTGIIIKESTFALFALSTSLFYGFLMMRGPLWSELFGLKYELGTFIYTYASITALSLLLFAYKFLDINPADKIIYQAFRLIIVITIPFPFVVTLLPSWWTVLLYSVHLFAFICTILGAGIARILKSNSIYSILYIAGWLPIGWSLISIAASVLVPDESHTKTTIDYLYLEETFWLLVHIFFHALSLIIRVKDINTQAIKANYLNQAKSNFIASSSHDLRQPLHAMKMYISALQEYTSEPKARSLLKSLEYTHRQMNQSFLSIMELSKLEAGAVKVMKEHYPLSDLFNQLRLEYSDLARAKFIELKVRGTNIVVDTDPLLLERILRNLINNAIKYTDSGKILVGARRKGPNVVIKVYDTGKGIPENEQEKIFDVYSRLSHEVEGAGIGLSIVKHMATLLNYNVTVESEVGRGSVFSVELPRVQEAKNFRALQSRLEHPASLAFTLFSTDPALVHHFKARFQIFERKTTSVHFSLATVNNLQQLKADLSGMLLIDSAVFENAQQLVDFANSQNKVFNSVVIIDSDKYSLHTLKQHRVLVIPKNLETIQVRALIRYAENHILTI